MERKCYPTCGKCLYACRCCKYNYTSIACSGCEQDHDEFVPAGHIKFCSINGKNIDEMNMSASSKMQKTIVTSKKTK